MENPLIEHDSREAERYTRIKDEWRKAAIVSLAVGNGGGLAALAAWSSRLGEFTHAVELFLPGMWIYTAGLILAGGMPFAAWWNAHALAEVMQGQRDEELAERIEVKGSKSLSRQAFMQVRAEYRKEQARFIRPSIYVLRSLLGASVLCFIAATFVSLWTVSTSNVFGAAAAGKATPERRSTN